MQGTHPAFQGGDTVTLIAGVDFTLQDGPLNGHKIGLDTGVPIYQDLPGLVRAPIGCWAPLGARCSAAAAR